MGEAAGDPERFITANTTVTTAPLVPEFRLRLATEVVPIWTASEDALQRQGLPPPFWAFAWAGGQALARFILDHPHVVASRRVLDFACGCGLAGIAAVHAGGRVTVNDIDPFALSAARANAALNNVPVAVRGGDLTGGPTTGWDVILAGDVCYEGPLSERIIGWLQTAAASGTEVLLGDPGRTYLPQTGLTALARYRVATSLELEDAEEREGVVWQLNASPPEEGTSQDRARRTEPHDRQTSGSR